MTGAAAFDFFGGGALAAPVVRAPSKPNVAQLAVDKKNAAARAAAEARRVEQQRQVANATAQRKRADEQRWQREYDARMAADPGPAGQRWREQQRKIHSAGSGGVLGAALAGAEAGVSAAAKGAGAAVQATAKLGRTIGRELAAVPVVGVGLKGLFDLTINAPFQVADRVSRGQRLDQVALASLRDQVAATQAVAPYARTVVSLVPAVGPGISAGIGAGLALASGSSLSDALIEGVSTALPGGALARTAFALGKGAIEGKSLDALALDALPLGPAEQAALRGGLDAARRIARGENVADSLLAQADRALALLPPEARGALQTGVAIAQGRSLQTIAARGVSAAGAAGIGVDVVSFKMPKVSAPKLSLSLPKINAPKVNVRPPALAKTALKAATTVSGKAKSTASNIGAKATASAAGRLVAATRAATVAATASKLAGAKTLQAALNQRAPAKPPAKQTAPKAAAPKVAPKQTAPKAAAPKVAAPKVAAPKVAAPKAAAPKAAAPTVKAGGKVPAGARGTFVPSAGPQKGVAIVVAQ